MKYARSFFAAFALALAAALPATSGAGTTAESSIIWVNDNQEVTAVWIIYDSQGNPTY